MRIGVFKTSFKENERRIPIYPEHLPRFSRTLRSRMMFENDYGRDYGFEDDYFRLNGVTMCDRDTLFSNCQLLVLPKPLAEDLAKMLPGQILFGWAHCVQQQAMAQAAIDRRTTIIAWESMNLWTSAGEKLMHLFYKNNEIAGYAAVLHCLQLLGIDGHYGPRRRVVVLSYGSVSRGAIYALQGRGFNNIHVFTQRPAHYVADQNPDVYHGSYFLGSEGRPMSKDSEGIEAPLIEQLEEADIICNGILQDTNNPFMFVREHEIEMLKPRSLIIDISCDKGMGFAFAQPTTFLDPVFQIGSEVTYYSVDHTPSYLWNAASREISKVMLSYLEIVASGKRAWEDCPTLRRALEIVDGVVLNPNIVRFQRRKLSYPHEIDIQSDSTKQAEIL